MLVRLLVGGLLIWIAASVIFTFGAWWATRHKWDDLKAAYLRGYNEGWEAYSNGGTMNESAYQAKLIKQIRELIPKAVVMKNDSSYMPGIPDILILYDDHWAMLEVKLHSGARQQPNQDYYVNLLGSMSFASFIYPEIEEAVLHDLQCSFGLVGKTRLS